MASCLVLKHCTCVRLAPTCDLAVPEYAIGVSPTMDIEEAVRQNNKNLYSVLLVQAVTRLIDPRCSALSYASVDVRQLSCIGGLLLQFWCFRWFNFVGGLIGFLFIFLAIYGVRGSNVLLLHVVRIRFALRRKLETSSQLLVLCCNAPFRL